MNKLAVDLNTNTNNNLGRIKKCDSTELEIILKNGQDYSKCSFRLLGIKADGKRVEQLDNYKLLENKLTFNLNREFTTCEGIVKLELNVFKDHEEITTQTFYFLVSNTLNSEIITSSEDIKTLRDLEHYILVANNALQDINKTINALQDTSNKIIPVENERIENEAARKQDEKFRTASEKDRIAAEKVRVKSEDDRNNTEEERVINENTRQSNELKRKTAENLRVKREDAREAAEVLRQELFEENEGIRNESENTRIKNENKRILSENIRIENENNRILQEEDRQKKEDIRIKNEDLRADAEKIREQQEANREKHYNDFNNAESDRVKAEKIREQQESERIEAESKRNELYNQAEKKRDLSFEEAERNRTRIYNVAEDERTENEKNRIIAESKRNSKEDIRIKNEDLRATAEKIREQQEANRNNAFEESQRNREELYKVSENKREQAESARVEAEKIREQQETERIEAEKIREEKIEQFGSQVTKNTKNIADNSKDIERAFETINDNSFIPFESENVTIEHSKVGFTKDMQIEGMTYKNIIPKGFNSYKLLHSDFVVDNNKITMIGKGGYPSIVYKDFNFKPDKIYTLIVNVLKLDNIQQQDWCIFRVGEGDGKANVQVPNPTKVGLYITKFTTLESTPIDAQTFLRAQANGKTIILSDLIILEGDYTKPNSYIPSYFEGIKSVGEKENKINTISHSKNLFNLDGIEKIFNYKEIENGFEIYSEVNPGYSYANIKKYMYLKKGTYTFSYQAKGNGFLNVAVRDKTENVSYSGDVRPNIPRTFTIDADKEVAITFYLTDNKVNDTSYRNKYTHIQLELSDKANIYEPYKENKKEILLPFLDGLKGLPSGSKDIIYSKEDGCYIRQKIGKKPLSLTINNWVLREDLTNETFISFQMAFSEGKSSASINDFLCNLLPNKTQWDTLEEGCWFDNNLIITLKKSTLSEPNLEKFKEWLITNNVEAYYVLAEPIEHKIEGLNSINLETFKDITHVSSENEIQPKLSFKAPVDIPKTISSLRNANTMLIAQNVGLENKNKQLEKVNTQQTEALKDISSTTDFLIEDALTRKLNN